MREDSIADLGLAYPEIHRLLAEFGRRLVSGGALNSPDEIYWLEAQELENLAALLDRGEVLPDLAGQLASRKAKLDELRRLIPPTTLPQKSWMAKLMPGEDTTGSQLKGFGASAGRVTARACVMLGPEDFNRMQPGDVIVAGITTPAWTPLFARAAGIVTDIGGPLSHSSIVAREYGIPAVLGTAVGTRRIRDGQTISVDGTAGTVTLHESGSDGGGSLDWTPPDPKGVFMRTSVVDLLPDPVSPLFATFGIPALVSQMMPMGKYITRLTPVLPKDYFTTINSYAYMNARFSARSWVWIVFGMLLAYPRLLRTMMPFWRDVARPGYRRAVSKLSEGQIDQTDSRRFMAGSSRTDGCRCILYRRPDVRHHGRVRWFGGFLDQAV